MRIIYIIGIVLLITGKLAYSQVGINDAGIEAHPSAILDVSSTEKGVLLPRMTFNERNAIINPAEGLIVFCTNCGLGGTGSLCVYFGGEWYNFGLCKIAPPTPGTMESYSSSIVWNWNSVPGAEGYKWGTTSSLDSAVDLGPTISHTEIGLLCDSLYSRYVWSYNSCGYSMPLSVSQLTDLCFTCGQSINVNHVAGNVAPVNKSTSYSTVSNVPGETSKCWITSNLGSDHQATAVNDATEASAGWYWQFNRIQGFKHDGTTRTPSSSWISFIGESSDWISSNDPCASELGNDWRVPTKTEWLNVFTAGGWGTWSGPWNSFLKLHAAGRLNYTDGSLGNRGVNGIYWSSTENNAEFGWRLTFSSGACSISATNKSYGFSVRCIR